MSNEMRSLSDAEVDAVAGGYYDLLVSSVIAPPIATGDRDQSASRERE